jgi:DNA-directed RNA polymerase subunit RPC12/RpoP
MDIQKCIDCESDLVGADVIPDFSNKHMDLKCPKCGYTIQYSLPELDRKVIYLDSNFLINASHGDVNYLRIYEKLKHLTYTKQMVICPNSEVHEYEVYGSPAGDFLFTLNAGIGFSYTDSLSKLQIFRAFKNFLLESKSPLYLKEDFLESSPQWNLLRRGGAWSHTKIVKDKDKIVRELASIRDGRWCKGAVMEDIFQHEYLGFLKLEIDRYAQNRSGMCSPSARIYSIVDLLRTNGYIQKDIVHALNSFCIYIGYNYIPKLLIEAALFTGYAYDYVKGSKTSIDGNTLYDIWFLGSYLPFCDAMFIDKPMFNLINQIKSNPGSRGVPDIDEYCCTNLFIHSTLDEFENYLDDLESGYKYQEVSDKIGVYYP